MAKKYYEILEINKDADLSLIRKAYKNLALKWHPDKFSSANSLAKTLEEAIRKIKEINEAYEILSDEEKKKKYDNNENVSVEKYGYDYGEEIPLGELAVGKYLNHKKAMDKAWYQLFDFVVASGEERKKKLFSDFHLIRAKNLLKILNSYYKPRYLAARNEMDRAKVMEDFYWWDNTSGVSNEENWKSKFNRIRRNLDLAREYLELPKLTDAEIGIIRVKDGIASVEEYNKSFTKENNETIREYENLRGMIYNKPEYWQKYQAVDSALLKEMDKKAIEAERGIFREIWASDGESKIAEIKSFNESKLTKMKEVIRLMKNLVEKGENYKPPIENTPTKDKKQVEAELGTRKEISERKKVVSVELDRLIHEAKEVIRDYDKLDAKIKEIDKYQGEETYKDYQPEISLLKFKLISLYGEKYRKGAVEKIESELRESGINESELELDDETKRDLPKVRNNEINDLSEIDKIKDVIISAISKKKFSNILDNLLKEANDLVENVAKGTVDKLQRLRKGLYNFQFNSNIHCQEVFEEKKTEVTSALNKLESISYSEIPEEGTSLFRPEVIIPVSLVSLLFLGMVLVIRKVRRR